MELAVAGGSPLISRGDGFSAENVEVFAGSRLLLEVQKLEIPGGRATAILGPGGSGKSLLLTLLADPGALPPQLGWRGSLRYPERLPAFLPQHPPEARGSVGEVLRRRLGCEERALGACLDRAWSAVPCAREAIDGYLPLAYDSLAAPLRRLVELTAALADAATCLVLDEPEAELGSPQRDWLERQLLARKGGASLLIATHDLRIAKVVADDLVLLVEGSILASGRAADLFRRPPSLRVRHLLTMGS